MAEGDSEDDKQYDPSPKKLEDARKKGEIPRSQDLTTAASYFGFILAGLLFGPACLLALATVFQTLFEQSDRLSTEWFNGSGFVIGMSIMQDVGANLAPLIITPIAIILALLFATKSIVFAPSKIEPKLSKISLISNAKNKFGRSGLFEFAKSFSKLMIYSIILGVYLLNRMPELVATISLSPSIITVTLLELVMGFMAIVLAISMVIGGIDYLFQYSEHMRKNRMSRKEMTDEAKSQEGDPHLKQHRRQMGHDIAMNQMMSDVENADVIIVNPTHYAIALKWDRMMGGAPVCVAKGVDEIAAKIREKAHEHAIPINSDPPTARAIYATVDLGEEIFPEHYQAVAASIRFAETMRQKMKTQFGARSNV